MMADYPLSQSELDVGLESSPVSLTHNADFHRRYPGQIVTLFTQIEVETAITVLTLTISLPAGLVPLTYHASIAGPEITPETSTTADGRQIVWEIERDFVAGDRLIFQLQTRVASAEQKMILTSQAIVRTRPKDEIVSAVQKITITDVVNVSHEADFTRRYPGQMVTFRTCIATRTPLPGFTLDIILPTGLQLVEYQLLPNPNNDMPEVETMADLTHIMWSIEDEVSAGAWFEYQVRALVRPVMQETELECRAVLTSWMRGQEAIFASEQATVTAAAISHVADMYRHYPGDVVEFFTRVGMQPPFSLTVILPPGLTLTDFEAPAEFGPGLPEIETYTNGTFLTWHVAEALDVPLSGSYRVAAKVDHRQEMPASDSFFRVIKSDDWTLECQAEVRSHSTTEGIIEQPTTAVETATVTILGKGRYLKHLPAMYERDEFLGRYLMLFERFWGPIETQIDTIAYYFDPGTVPADLLPWLASWVNMPLDNNWSEQRQRELLRSAISLYRKRGTKQGLIETLQIFTGGEVKITEHRGANFQLGIKAHLGRSIALGTENQANSFTVTLRLPAITALQDSEVQAKKKRELHQKIEAIIQAEKPAHTNYVLRIEPLLIPDKLTPGGKPEEEES